MQYQEPTAADASPRRYDPRPGEPGLCSPEQRLRHVTDALRSADPALSAATPMWLWQRLALATFPALAALSLAGLVSPLLHILAVVLSLAFAVNTGLRLIAFFSLQTDPPGQLGPPRPSPSLHWVPEYSVLVPLYREVAVIPHLVDALCDLDYPTNRLQILLVTEADDDATAAALSRHTLPSHFEILRVPPSLPRTKPKALCYALQHARGEYVVIYDAEDQPQSDQLWRALEAFAEDPRLACVQARLNIYNPAQNWLTRHFTLEYTLLFDAILPALVRLDWPIPLGGTSNHLRRSALDEVGGWDPYNVTEDADLGYRLARFGWRVTTISSTTWEEAPTRLTAWIGQRTRWLKGWLQTFLVHTREPVRLWRDLSTWRYFGFHVLMVSLLAAPLLHPWCLAMLAWISIGWFTGAGPTDENGMLAFQLTSANLLASYAATAALATRAVPLRHPRHLLRVLWTIPIYWLLISYAAHRALLQFFLSPYHWEKTEHGQLPAPPRQP